MSAALGGLATVQFHKGDYAAAEVLLKQAIKIVENSVEREHPTMAAVLEELETRLLSADVGIQVTTELLDALRKRVARKELAKDLHYSGDMNDSAAMNMWLHKEVMKQLAANGGKVPQDLLGK